MPHVDIDTVSVSSAGTDRFTTPRREEGQSAAALKAKAHQLEAELQRCEAEAATLKNREHSLKEQNKKLSRVLEEKDTGLMQAKTREAQLTAEHSEQVYKLQQQHSAALEAVRTESRKGTQQLQAQLQQAQLQCEETNYHLQQGKAKIQMMQQQLEQQRSATVERASQLELEGRQKDALNAELRKSTERLKEQLTKKEKKLDIVMQQIRQSNVDDETRSSLLKQKLVECTTRLREIEEQYSNLQSHHDDHESETRHQQHMYEIQQENLRAMEALKADYRRKEQSLMSQLQQTRETVSDLEFVLSQEKTKYNVLEQRCRQLEGMTHDNELYMKEVEQQQQRLDIMQTKLQESTSRLQTLQERERALEHSHVSTLQNAQDKHEKLILQLQGEHRTREAALQMQVQTLSLNLEDAQTQKASQDTKVAALEMKLHTVESQSSAHREKAAELEFTLRARETGEVESARRIEQLKAQVKEQETTLQDALGKLRLLINKSTSLHECMEAERTKLQLLAAEVRADGDVHLESVLLKMCRKMQSNDNTIEYPKAAAVFKALYSRTQSLARNNAVLSDEIVNLKNRNFTRDDEKSTLKEKVRLYEDRLHLLERLLGDRDKERCAVGAQTDLKGGRFLRVPEMEDSGLQVELSPPLMSASSATNETEISMASVTSSNGPSAGVAPPFLPTALTMTKGSGGAAGSGGDAVLSTLGEMQAQIQMLQQRLEQKELHITRYTEANSKVNVENLKTDLQQISKQFSHLRRKVDTNNDVDTAREECKRLLSLALNKEAAIAELQSKIDELTKREDDKSPPQRSSEGAAPELEKCYSLLQRLYVQMVSACESKPEANIHEGDIHNRVNCALSDLLLELRAAREARTRAEVLAEMLRKELTELNEKGNYSTIDRLAVRPNGPKKSKTTRPSTHVVNALEAIVGDLKTHNRKFEEKMLGDSQSVTDLDALLENMQQLQNLIRVSDTRVREISENLQAVAVELQPSYGKTQLFRVVVESVKLAECTLTDFGTMEETCHWILYSCISSAVGMPSAPTSPTAGPRHSHGALFSPPAAAALSRSPTKTREVPTLGTARPLYVDAQSQHMGSPPAEHSIGGERSEMVRAIESPSAGHTKGARRHDSPSDRKTSKGDSIIQDLVRHTNNYNSSPQLNGRVRRIVRSNRRHSFTA